MPSLIESLIGGGTKRPDEKRLVPARRPLPARPRALLELLVSLGQQASLPRHLTYVVLNRWPTLAELAAVATPYEARQHLRDLLFSEEFRAGLFWRICDSYPERQRLLYVRIPRCAGDHFLHMAGTMHALFPPGLAHWTRQDRGTFIPALGSYLGRFNLTRTIQATLPALAPFIQIPPPSVGDAALPWLACPPPRRPGDRLFTIIREPAGLILSQVNAILASVAAPAQADEGEALAQWRDRLGSLPREADRAGWKAAGRRVLAGLAMRNPICSALGRGTAPSAREACRYADIEIADLRRYADWVNYTWNVEPEPATNAAAPVLTRQDLDASDAGRLADLIEEDLAFYATIAATLAGMPNTKITIKGSEI